MALLKVLKAHPVGEAEFGFELKQFSSRAVGFKQS